MNELKMTLDEISEQNRKNRQLRGRLRRGRSSRPSQRGRSNSYSNTYRQRRFTNNPSRRVLQKPLSSSNRRLQLTNLNKEITNAKLKQLFEQYGTLTRCGVHFDKMGESKGTADIEYSTHEEAEKAIKEMNKADINGVTVDVKYKPRKRLVSAGGVNRRNNARRSGNVTLRRTKIRRNIARRRNVSNERGRGRKMVVNDDNQRRRRNNRIGGGVKYRKYKNSLGTRRRRN